jgi:ABC-2 type transport system permease protein
VSSRELTVAELPAQRDVPTGVRAALRTLRFQAWVFVKRGFIHTTSYRLNFTLSIINVFIGLVSYFYLSHAYGDGQLGVFSNNKAGWIIVGTTFNTFVSVALASYSGSIRSEMFLGTIEHWLLSASTLTRLVVLSTIWEFLWPLVTTTITFIALVLILGVHFDIEWTTSLVFFLLAVVVMSGFGLISAGIIMISKIGDPLSLVWTAVNTLLIGAVFPVTVLPDWMQQVSRVLPNTHALTGLREGMLNHASLASQSSEVFSVLVFCAITVPLGVVIFRLGFERARAQGTLAQF